MQRFCGIFHAVEKNVIFFPLGRVTQKQNKKLGGFSSSVQCARSALWSCPWVTSVWLISQ